MNPVNIIDLIKLNKKIEEGMKGEYSLLTTPTRILFIKTSVLAESIGSVYEDRFISIADFIITTSGDVIKCRTSRVVFEKAIADCTIHSGLYQLD